MGDGIYQKRNAFDITQMSTWHIAGGIIGSSGNLYTLDSDEISLCYVTKLDSSYAVLWSTACNKDFFLDNFVLSPDEAFLYVSFSDATNTVIYQLDTSTGVINIEFNQ